MCHEEGKGASQPPHVEASVLAPEFRVAKRSLARCSWQLMPRASTHAVHAPVAEPRDMLWPACSHHLCPTCATAFHHSHPPTPMHQAMAAARQAWPCPRRPTGQAMAAAWQA